MINKNQREKLEEKLSKIEGFKMPIEPIIEQLESFEKGFETIELVKPALIGDGIWKVGDEKYIEIQKRAAKDGRFIKFVPASGAASRMFRKLESINSKFEQIDESLLKNEASNGNAEAEFTLTFVENIREFAFFNSLKYKLAEHNFDIEKLLNEKNYKPIIDFAITEKGLNLSSLPKAAIDFHLYKNYPATPIEEHIEEAKSYCADNENEIKIHFTISSDHKKLFESVVDAVTPKFENEGFELGISYSEQKKSTDTIAVDLDNNPFDDNGKLLFRPAGHGALLENLNDLNADIIYIKNIDNVVPKNSQEATIRFKQILGGILVDIQTKVFNYLNSWESFIAVDGLPEIMSFCQNYLNIVLPENFEKLNDDEKKKYIFNEMNRPIRVCGMVKNEGDPGGGPFWVKGSDGNISLQIVETSQLNLSDDRQKEIFDKATHFNPVDLVCGVKNYKGENFNLLEYRDPSTAFITQKSKDGKPLKAIELPGLWNGSMAFWNTIFVEVPISTFAPVKEVNDLLKPQHRT